MYAGVRTISDEPCWEDVTLTEHHANDRKQYAKQRVPKYDAPFLYQTLNRVFPTSMSEAHLCASSQNIRNLGDVVQALRREVTHAVLRVAEARKQGFQKAVHIWCNVDSERDCSASQADEPAIANM